MLQMVWLAGAYSRLGSSGGREEARWHSDGFFPVPQNGTTHIRSVLSVFSSISRTELLCSYLYLGTDMGATIPYTSDFAATSGKVTDAIHP